jgi:hypothetical protein
MDDLGFVEAVDRLGQSVVIAVADAADGRLDAGFRQALGVTDETILLNRVGWWMRLAAMRGPTLVQCLLQRIQHEAGMRGPAHSPAHDAAGIRVDDEGHIDEARPGR